MNLIFNMRTKQYYITKIEAENFERRIAKKYISLGLH